VFYPPSGVGDMSESGPRLQAQSAPRQNPRLIGTARQLVARLGHPPGARARASSVIAVVTWSAKQTGQYQYSQGCSTAKSPRGQHPEAYKGLLFVCRVAKIHPDIERPWAVKTERALCASLALRFYQPQPATRPTAHSTLRCPAEVRTVLLSLRYTAHTSTPATPATPPRDQAGTC
jgi:hypothetical protein